MKTLGFVSIKLGDCDLASLLIHGIHINPAEDKEKNENRSWPMRCEIARRNYCPVPHTTWKLESKQEIRKIKSLAKLSGFATEMETTPRFSTTAPRCGQNRAWRRARAWSRPIPCHPDPDALCCQNSHASASLHSSSTAHLVPACFCSTLYRTNTPSIWPLFTFRLLLPQYISSFILMNSNFRHSRNFTISLRPSLTPLCTIKIQHKDLKTTITLHYHNLTRKGTPKLILQRLKMTQERKPTKRINKGISVFYLSSMPKTHCITLITIYYR